MTVDEVDENHHEYYVDVERPYGEVECDILYTEIAKEADGDVQEKVCIASSKDLIDEGDAKDQRE